jgi:ACS family hexuronate transporter-like MFS transporter
MISFAFAATLINYLDRQTLSVVAPALLEEFAMSNEAYGYVLSAFMLAYTVSNGLSGPILDRLGTRLGYARCMVWWSTAGILHALATGPWSLAGFRFLLGMGEAGNWPAGAAIGAIVAPSLVTWLMLQFGWPTAFICVGITGYVWLIGWWFVYYTPTTVYAETAAKPGTPWRLLKTRFLSVLTLAKVFLDPVWYFYIFRHDGLDSVRHRRPWQHCGGLADRSLDSPRLVELDRAEIRVWTIRVIDDLGDSGNSCHKRVGVSGPDIGRHFRLHRL